MRNGPVEAWFKKAQTCISEARRLFEGGFHEGAIARAFASVEATMTAALMEELSRGNSKDGAPKALNDLVSTFNDVFVKSNRLHSNAMSDFRYLAKMKIQCEETVISASMQTAENCVMHAERMLYQVRKAFEPVKEIRRPTLEEIKAQVGPYTPRR